MPGRGRGRGRGRGGHRGRGRGRGGAPPSQPTDEYGLDAPSAAKEEQLDIHKDVKSFFVGTAGFMQHYTAQEENKNRYAAGLAALEKSGVELSQNARVRALAAALARRDHEFAESLLCNRDLFGLVEVLKAITLLDSSRRIRVHEKKMKQMQLTGKSKPKKIGLIKSNINSLNTLKPQHGSASGAICRHIRRWVRNFSKDELEFYALHLPSEPWKRLADICHFNPRKDFPNLEWFLPYCYGEAPPEGTMVHNCRELSADNVNDLVKEYDIPYSHIKTYKDKLTMESKARIASYTPKIDTVIWYYEDLRCEETDQILLERLQSGEEVSLTYGKLMERLLTIKIYRENITFRKYWYGGTTNDEASFNRDGSPTKAAFLPHLYPQAERMLKAISLPLEQPIVVIGDRSGSMEVAIRTSTIIASLLTAITSAKLVFFNRVNMDAQFIPKTIPEVLEMAITVSATGGTAPAASLYPFYEKKEVVKTFVVVTDEEENSNFKDYRFADLFKKYHAEVYPAKLVFVSFLRSQHAVGQMVRQLNDKGFHPLQFVFDNSRPDLGKLGNLFGLLASDSDSFDDQVAAMEQEINTQGIVKLFQRVAMNEQGELT